MLVIGDRGNVTISGFFAVGFQSVEKGVNSLSFPVHA